MQMSVLAIVHSVFSGADGFMPVTKEDVLNDPILFDRMFEEWGLLKDVVERSPVPFSVYDKDDILVAWNQEYEDNHPDAFANHRDDAVAGKLSYQQLSSYEIAKSGAPDKQREELARRLTQQQQGAGNPITRNYSVSGDIRVFKYKLKDGGTAGFGFYIHDLVEAQRELSAAQAEAEAQFEELRRLLQAQTAAAAELAQAEERYRSLIESARDGITIVDFDTGLFVEDANPSIQQLYGFSREELLNKLGPADVSPEFQPDGRTSVEAASSYIEEAINGGAPTFDWVHQNAAGEQIPCKVTLTRFPDANRRLARASVTDQTEQIKNQAAKENLERQLSRSQRLESIGKMTGGVAHDFNNLLSIMLGNLELLQDKAIDPDARSLMANAIRAVEQGTGLTRSMLNYASQAPLKPENIDLNTVVRRMEGLISRTLPARITLRADFDNSDWLVTADPSTTESAILNLILNARDAMPHAGEILIKTATTVVTEADNDGGMQAGTYVLLSVEDTGTGIPEDILDKIADPFFTTKGIGQNSGLGLSMIEGFMTQSGGYLRIASQVGVGTTIKLYFPAVAVSAGQTDALQASTTETRAETDRQTCIMLIEDNDLVSNLLQRVLRQEGHRVLVASSTDMALDVFNKAPHIDLLISDIAIPGPMQGPELAREFKKTTPDLPVIFVSGYSFGSETQEAGLTESDLLLTKPVRNHTLLEAVNSVLAGQKDA